MASSKLTSSCSFLNLLLACLNFTLFLLSAASFAPTLLIKTPPSPLGAALLTVSSLSILSSLAGFYSHLSGFCFRTHLYLLLAAVSGQGIAIFALFSREKASLSMLRSRRDPREAKLLVRLECGALMAMLVVQVVVLAVACGGRWWCWEDESSSSGGRRRRRSRRVQEEFMGGDDGEKKIKEMKTKGAAEEEKKMKNKHGQWVKTDFEG